VLFATILVFSDPINPKKLWDDYKKFMIEDYVYNNNNSREEAEYRCLIEINSWLFHHQKTLNDYPSMPLPDFNNQEFNNNLLFNEETNFDVQKLKSEVQINLPKTNNDQFKIYL
jgi:hypothetical protein